MKTRTISFIISILVISSLVFLFQKKLNCQTNQLATSSKSEADKSRISISNPDVFPDSGPMFAEMWTAPEYILMDHIPEDIKVHHVRQPVITDQQIFIPMLSSLPDVLVFDRAGHFQRRIEFDFLPDAVSDIHIFPDRNEILVGDSQQKRISVFDLEGVRKEDKPVGFHFLYFAYSPTSDRYIFYLASDGLQASEKALPFAITITDARFNVLHRLFPLSSLAFKAPYFSSQRFQVEGSSVYYNPDYSDQLYAIDFDGEIELMLDLQLANQEYLDAMDLLTGRPFTPANVQMLKEKLAVDYFLVGKEYVFVGKIPQKHNKDLVIQRSSARSMLVNYATLITNFGDHFNFGYTRPSFMVNDKCISIRNAKDYNLSWDFIDSKEQLNHLPGRIADNQWVMMIFNPNDKVWFPPKETESPTSSLSIEMFPNPAHQSCKIQLAGLEGDFGLQIYSTDGVMRYDEKGTAEGQPASIVVNVSNWTPGAYVVQCTISDAVYARTLIIQ
ncbi:MAG: 6-bladed beta-propeller [Saprospiraceae bacterium]|nr:6-bladed beta-propeller [Saprospiraceae bacterium]